MNENTTPLAVQLRRQPDPTSEEHLLAEQVGLHDGAEVPFHMFAKMAVQVHDHSWWFGEIKKFGRQVRRRALAGLGFLAINVAAIAGHWLSVHDARIAGEARAEAAERAFEQYRAGVARDFERVESEIAQLRAALLRLGVVAPEPPKVGSPTSDFPDPMDKVSIAPKSGSAHLASVVPADLLPPPRPQPKTCGDTCSSNTECQRSFFPVCKYCNFGTCSATRPESSTSDAGVSDAPADR